MLTLAHFLSAAMVVARSDLVMTATSVLADTVEGILPVRSVRHPLDAPTVTIGQIWDARHDDDPAHRWFRQMVSEVAAAAVPGRRMRTRVRAGRG
ncbi:MAG: hypothetical protein IT379_37845 [Deltaproteobacteria bacterium]|nr:hypothetical protein [Deltaproteobacteria bacterium]